MLHDSDDRPLPITGLVFDRARMVNLVAVWLAIYKLGFFVDILCPRVVHVRCAYYMCSYLILG